MKKSMYTLLCVLFAGALGAQSNLFVDQTISPEQMVMDFFNNSQVTVSNVQFTGASSAVAFFEAANTDLDLLAGLMLSTGDCMEAQNPASYFANHLNATDGDDDLNAILDQLTPTFDAAVLEFDLVSQVDTLCFIYRFGSEEYPEYVCSNFNDIFAFFISGPGYSGLSNIALVPGDTLPVAINNVNNGNPNDLNCSPSHPEFYVDYASLFGQHAAFDGFTTTLPAKFAVQPGESYHVKIALSDVSDGVFDSGVFLAINSLGGDSLLSPVAEMAAPVLDGNTVSVNNLSRYGTAWHWDFGDGFVTNERHPAPHTYPQFAPNDPDARTEYEITLVVSNYCCQDTLKAFVSTASSAVDDVQEHGFRLSPNPATEQLLIEPATSGEFALRVYNGAGQLVRQQTASAALRIDIQSLVAGVYTCELVQGKRLTRQRFVIK